jgi:hypothetical protein
LTNDAAGCKLCGVETTNMNLTFAAKIINKSGFALTAHTRARMDRVLEKFSEGRMEGYYDPDSGYDGTDEVGVVDNLGREYYVYARDGAVRIGTPWFGVKDEDLQAQYVGAQALAELLSKECS